MFSVLQHGKVFATALAETRIAVLDPVRQELRAWPWLCDMLGHINHAKYLELASLGRVAWFVRTGLVRPLWQGGYSFPIAGAAMTYRREIPRMSRFAMETQVVAYDARWLCFCSTFLRGSDGAEQIAARVVIRGQLRQRDQRADLPGLMQRLGLEPDGSPFLPEDVAAQLQAQDAVVEFIRKRESRRA
jgi:acyl-CoA thioesterase FadM